MQGRPLDERELLDAGSVAGHLVDKGSVFGLLAEHRRVLFPEAMFADLFPTGRGRPSVPVDIAASVLVLQSLHGLSDREAMAALRTDLRWKVACGLPIGHGGFDPSTLTYWRNELALKPWRLLHGGWAALQGQVLAGRVVDLVADQLLAEDDFLAARAGSAGTEALAGSVAVVAPLLAEVAAVAFTAGVDGAVAA